MTYWNGKEQHAMATVPSKPEPDSPKNPQSNEDDPITLSMHVWVLRLWVVCALVIIAYAVCNYLASWWAK
jgi:hypothetical protein